MLLFRRSSSLVPLRPSHHHRRVRIIVVYTVMPLSSPEDPSFAVFVLSDNRPPATLADLLTGKPLCLPLRVMMCPNPSSSDFPSSCVPSLTETPSQVFFFFVGQVLLVAAPVIFQLFRALTGDPCAVAVVVLPCIYFGCHPIDRSHHQAAGHGVCSRSSSPLLVSFPATSPFHLVPSQLPPRCLGPCGIHVITQV